MTQKIDSNVTPLFSTALRLMSVTLFLTVGLMVFAQTAFSQADLTVQALKEKLESGDTFIFIDVREPFEYEEFNLGGELIPLGTIVEAAATSLSEKKEDEIVLICRSGARAGQARMMLTTQGFSNVRTVLGGLLAWEQAYGKTKPEVKPPSKTPPQPKAPDAPKFVKIYVGNLSADTTEQTLRNAFAEFGEVKSVKIVRDKDNNPIGYVEMAAADANGAIEQLNEGDLDGSEIVVKKAEPDKGN